MFKTDSPFYWSMERSYRENISELEAGKEQEELGSFEDRHIDSADRKH